jgi:hypothetical protein
VRARLAKARETKAAKRKQAGVTTKTKAVA